MKIIFLTYLNRSGSTYLANQLSKSPEICVCPEAEIIYDLFLKDPLKEFSSDKKKYWHLINELERDKKFSLWNLNRVEIYDQIATCSSNLEIFFAILTRYLRRNKPNATVLLYKDTRSIDLISKIPVSVIKSYDLRWISLIRDVRDVYLSQSTVISPLTKKPMCSNWYSLMKQWNSFVKLSCKYDGLNYYFRLRYEDLIIDTPMVMNNITATLGIYFQINWITEKKGELFDLLSPEYQAIHPLINEAPDKLRISAWKKSLSPSLQYFFSLYCKKTLEKIGYSSNRASLPPNLFYLLEIIHKKIRHYSMNFNKSIKRLVKNVDS